MRARALEQQRGEAQRPPSGVGTEHAHAEGAAWGREQRWFRRQFGEKLIILGAESSEGHCLRRGK